MQWPLLRAAEVCPCWQLPQLQDATARNKFIVYEPPALCSTFLLITFYKGRHLYPLNPLKGWFDIWGNTGAQFLAVFLMRRLTAVPCLSFQCQATPSSRLTCSSFGRSHINRLYPVSLICTTTFYHRVFFVLYLDGLYSCIQSSMYTNIHFHWARDEVHPGQVVSPSHGQHTETNNHRRSYSHLGSNPCWPTRAFCMLM